MKVKEYKKWDTHHHIHPEFYDEILAKHGYEDVYGMPTPKWSEKIMFNMMKGVNIERAVISISMPGVHFGDDDEARDLSRRANNYMADIVKRNPNRIGAFGVVPLPDVEGAIAEMKYCINTLKFDGLVILSNVNGVYFGDERYRKFWEEANRLNTVIYVHPCAPVNRNDQKRLEYFHYLRMDTARGITTFLKNGFHKEFPNIKFILSHGGGIFPAVFNGIMEGLKKENPNIEEEYEQWKTQLFLDNALTTWEEQLPKILELTGENHIIYGSDFCWASMNYKHYIKKAGKFDLGDRMYKKMFRDNCINALKKGEKVQFKPMKKLPAGVDYPNKSKDIKYHYHCNTENLIKMIKNADPSLDLDGIKPWDKKEADEFRKSGVYKKIMLSLGIDELWSLKNSDRNAIISKYNKELAEIKKQDPAFGALGAINIDDPENAIREIDNCLNKLKLDGVAIYTKIFDQDLEQFIDIDLMEKLAGINVPVLVHSQDTSGISILNDYYYDSTLFIFKAMFLGYFDMLKRTTYIPAHTHGLIEYYTGLSGLLPYMRPGKTYKLKLLYDLVITKNIKGTEYLKKLVAE